MPAAGSPALLTGTARRLLLVAALAASASGCVNPGTATPTARAALRLAVSADVAPSVLDLSPFPSERIVMQVCSGRAAIEDVSMGYADAALLWGIEPAVEPPLAADIVASDALAIIVHPDNRVGPLDRETVRHIFEGQVQDWAQLGQDIGPVQVITREPGSGIRSAFSYLVMDGRAVVGSALIASGSDDMLDYVAAHRSAIGYVAASRLREGVRALAVDGERPEPRKVREGQYSLMAGVWQVYRPREAGEAVLAWLLSREGQELLGRSYAAPELAFTWVERRDWTASPSRW